MNETDISFLREEIAKTIKTTVNGKIDRLTELVEEHNRKHEKDMEDIKPIIEAYQGFNTAGNLVKWIAGVGTAIGVLWITLMSLTK